jgi:hypothetical protein
MLDADPFYNTNLSLSGGDYTLGEPRRQLPWRTNISASAEAEPPHEQQRLRPGLAAQAPPSDQSETCE